MPLEEEEEKEDWEGNPLPGVWERDIDEEEEEEEKEELPTPIIEDDQELG